MKLIRIKTAAIVLASYYLFNGTKTIAQNYSVLPIFHV